MSNVECNDDVQRALEHMAAGEHDVGIEILKQYQGCHLTNLDCTYNGDDCAVQELIAGFVAIAGDSDKAP